MYTTKNFPEPKDIPNEKLCAIKNEKLRSFATQNSKCTFYPTDLQYLAKNLTKIKIIVRLKIII